MYVGGRLSAERRTAATESEARRHDMIHRDIDTEISVRIPLRDISTSLMLGSMVDTTVRSGMHSRGIVDEKKALLGAD